ncbi:hypothetical protein SAMN04488519_103138 [Algoriphagus ornithinivorans]|uniref:Uncharacterized protein n=1 Tax=Algoriphagus ornithinivorans TaxID=226506 RepID=A0A1I5DT94_9BACT|nr:hypothetical protein [Algoriphagus ornithinivorans]SFO02330.1 hypothetical protein SAMN04488519_103138 [Algoriphagus ornithinivorans]
MKKVLFGIAFLGAMAFAGVSVNAQQEEPDPGMEGGGGGCYQRMVICNGGYTVYHCDGKFTSSRCSAYEIGCLNC